MNGVRLTLLERISHPQGDLFRGLRADDADFAGFGEAYFSTIHHGVVKPWRLHTKLTMNLIVPVGSVRFVCYDDRSDSPDRGTFFEAVIGAEHYARLTVKPGVWMAFQGVGSGLNLILDITDHVHDPAETLRRQLDEIPYEWSRA